MNCRVVYMLACALTVVSATCRADSFQIYTNAGTGQDGFTYAGAPDGAFSTVFDIGAVSKTPGGAFDAIDYLQFDVASLGLNAADVTSAKVSVTQVSSTALHPSNLNPDAGHPMEIAVLPVTSSWSRATLTANTAPTFNASPEATFSVSGLGQVFEVDITDLVKSWIDGSVTNNGVRLEGTTIMGSGESMTDSPYYAAGIQSAFNVGGSLNTDGPLLTITTVPEPSTILLTTAAVPAFGWVAWRRRRRRRAR